MGVGVAPSCRDPSLLNRERLERLAYLDSHPGSEQASRDGHLVVAPDSDALASVGPVIRGRYYVNTCVRHDAGPQSRVSTSALTACEGTVQLIVSASNDETVAFCSGVVMV